MELGPGPYGTQQLLLVVILACIYPFVLIQGELGLAYVTDTPQPTKITKIPEGTKFKAVAVGAEHAVAITEAGQLVSWGGNDLGQLGNGTVKPADRPFPVKVPDVKEKFVSVSCGWKHSCAVTEGGVLYSWGAGHAGQLGDGEVLNLSLPKKVEIDVAWKDVRCGSNFTFAITSSWASAVIAYLRLTKFSYLSCSSWKDLLLGRRWPWETRSWRHKISPQAKGDRGSLQNGAQVCRRSYWP